MANYLMEEGIPFDEINSNSDCEWKSTNPLADLYIDDRACRFEGNWEKTLEDAKRHLGLEEFWREEIMKQELQRDKE